MNSIREVCWNVQDFTQNPIQLTSEKNSHSSICPEPYFSPGKLNYSGDYSKFHDKNSCRIERSEGKNDDKTMTGDKYSMVLKLASPTEKYLHEKSFTLVGTRTQNLQIRSLTRYPLRHKSTWSPTKKQVIHSHYYVFIDYCGSYSPREVCRNLRNPWCRHTWIREQSAGYTNEMLR